MVATFNCCVGVVVVVVVAVVGLLVSGQIWREYRTYDVGWECVS